MGQKVLFVELIKEEKANLHAEISMKIVLTKQFPTRAFEPRRLGFSAAL